MTTLHIEGESSFARVPVPAGAALTTLAAIIPFPSRYAEDVRRADDSSAFDLGEAFAVYADDSLEWAEATLNTPDSWPEA